MGPNMMYICMYMNFNITQKMVHNKPCLKDQVIIRDKVGIYHHMYVGVGTREGQGGL